MLDILIPTYNRCVCLERNLQSLVAQFSSPMIRNFKIIISDNCSEDETDEVIKNFNKYHEAINIEYHRNSENIGLEANVVQLMGYATAKYVMWVGDDDYIAAGYLDFCLEKMRSIPELGVIIPGIREMRSPHKSIDRRNEGFEWKQLNCGYESVLQHSHLAHQMSGIVLRRENLLSAYLKKPENRNPYLFIFWTAHNLFYYPAVYAPKFKTSIAAYNTKDWGYNEVGLLDEVYKNYYSFDGKLSSREITDLLIKFTVMHSYRLSFLTLNPARILREYFHLLKVTPGYRGFRIKLAVLFIKEYINVLLHLKWRGLSHP